MRRRNLYVGQSSLFEIIFSAILIFMVILIVHFFITSHYASKIKNLHVRNEYKTAALVYKILQSDQLFSLTSRERGFLDKVKLHVFLKNDPQKVCNMLRILTGRKVAVKITDIEAGNGDTCINKETYEDCSYWYICEENPKGVKYDIFVTLYDPLTKRKSIGKLDVWIKN